MVYGNIRGNEDPGILKGKLQWCLEYARTHDLSFIEDGSYPLQGKEIVLNINRFSTASPETRGWEAHKFHADLQLVLEGREQIDVNFLDRMEPGVYDETRDFLPLTGRPAASVVLDPGDFALLYPQDAHMPGIAPDGPGPVVKAVFKILL